VAYVIGLNDYAPVATDTTLLLNRQWLGAAILSFAAFALALLHERHRKVVGLHVVLFALGGFWWLVGGLTQMDRAHETIGAWQFAILYLGVGAAGFAVLRAQLAWDRLNWMVGAIALMGLAMVPYAQSEFGTPFTAASLPGWAVYALAMGYALWQARAGTQRSLVVAHLAALWSLGLALTLQAGHFASVNNLAQGWRFLAELAPAALMTTALWRYPAIAAWPRAQAFPRYAIGWFLPVLLVLAVAWVAGLFAEGDASPLPYLPLVNPLELALLGLAGLMGGFVRDRMPDAAPMLRGWPLLAFAFLTIATLRAVHHLHGEPWGPAVLDSGFSQAALTIVWSMVGVGAWIYGSRRLSREVWMGGAALMGLVLAKLLLVDRLYWGDLSGIVSFLAVGALLVGVGWIAPSPPRARTAPPAAAPMPVPAPPEAAP
jgi:uncharacterized membrane protein